MGSYKGKIENAKGIILKNRKFEKSQMKNRDMQIHPMGKVFFFVEVSTHQISRDES